MTQFIEKTGTCRALTTCASMGQGASLFAGVIALALTACGPGGETSPNETAGVIDRGENEHAAFLGPVSYRYNRRVLTAANVRVAIPPEVRPNVNALKLVPARSADGSAPLCPPAAPPDCPIEDQPGVSLALLERPYQSYSDALQASDLADRVAPVTVGGAEGIAVDFGDLDGLQTEYRLVPMGERALLLKLQFNGQSASELAAMRGVIESIDLTG